MITHTKKRSAKVLHQCRAFMFEKLIYICYTIQKITVVGIRDFYYVFTTFDGINLPRFAPF